MFAYCIDNPVNLADFDGKDSVPLENINELTWWSSYMWWLCGLDGPFPFGDIIYSSGILLLSGIALKKINSDNPTKTEKEDVKKPEVNYPGDDPAKAPSDDYEWHGKPPQGGEKGGYTNKNGKDSWHPDLKHKGKIGPHWDYNDGKGNHWRVFPDGRIDLKE